MPHLRARFCQVCDASERASKVRLGCHHRATRRRRIGGIATSSWSCPAHHADAVARTFAKDRKDFYGWLARLRPRVAFCRHAGGGLIRGRSRISQNAYTSCSSTSSPDSTSSTCPVAYRHGHHGGVPASKRFGGHHQRPRGGNVVLLLGTSLTCVDRSLRHIFLLSDRLPAQVKRGTAPTVRPSQTARPCR